MNNDILNIIKKEVPTKPGCYIYYNKDDEIIYVGKAKNLKKRMMSYFNRHTNIKTDFLVSKITKFDYFITNNENEALVLENNLIKKHNPFYNIALKDDKTYPYLLLTDEKHPRIIKTRKRNQKGTYFGPYPSGTFIHELMWYVNKKTKLRKCLKLPKKECIYFHINQCYAPCVKDIDGIEVKKYKEEVKKYLKNDMKYLKQELKNEMLKFADEMRFEEANKNKLLIEMIDNLNKEQYVQFSKDINVSIFDYYKDDNFVSIVIVEVKDGKLINIHRSLTPYYENEINDIFSYIYRYYQFKKKPDQFVTVHEELGELIENVLLINKRSEKFKEFKELSNLAQENSLEYYRKNINKITSEYFTKENSGYSKLQEITGDNLKRIEMYDISHIGGDAQVGSMIVYLNGIKTSSEYRKYKIKDKSNLKDDYGSIKEVLDRRISRGIVEKNLPDLIIVDGGKGQVSSAISILEKYGLCDTIKLIGLSKDDKHKTKGMVNKNLDEKILNKKSELYKFLYELQEEVHRYAIDFHRKVKINSLFKSELDKIYGLGPKRKKLLLERFEYLENIQNAKYEELKELKIPETVIKQILEHFSN